MQSLINKAQNAYNKAIEAQKNGDWEGYGKYIKQLENYLSKLSSESGGASAGADAAAAGTNAAADTATADAGAGAGAEQAADAAAAD